MTEHMRRDMQFNSGERSIFMNHPPWEITMLNTDVFKFEFVNRMRERKIVDKKAY